MPERFDVPDKQTLRPLAYCILARQPEYCRTHIRVRDQFDQCSEQMDAENYCHWTSQQGPPQKAFP